VEQIKEKCSSCKFYKIRGMGGVCRFNPPTPPLDPNKAVIGEFVKVCNNDWCGQYKRRPISKTLPKQAPSFNID